MEYQRTATIERSESDDPGVLHGTLTTDGEASDGHILNIDGAQLPERAPLLFGHDDFTGTGNLGSWESFRMFKNGESLGDAGIRGTARIELTGEPGAALDKRKDIAHMIDRGHIGAFSVRWAEVEEPVARVNLPKDHPAFVDAKTETGRKRYGYYFDKWRLLEGSVVTLGADPAALIGRMQESQGDVRQFWRSAINRHIAQTEPLGGLVGIDVGGELIYVERAAYDAMLEAANERLALALDLHERIAQERIAISESAGVPKPATLTGSDNAPKPAARECQEPASVPSPKEIFQELRVQLKQAAREVAEERKRLYERARGVVK